MEGLGLDVIHFELHRRFLRSSLQQNIDRPGSCFGTQTALGMTLSCQARVDKKLEIRMDCGCLGEFRRCRMLCICRLRLDEVVADVRQITRPDVQYALSSASWSFCEL
jgi:hypothetical protein